jgi:hypothetical protein
MLVYVEYLKHKIENVSVCQQKCMILAFSFACGNGCELSVDPHVSQMLVDAHKGVRAIRFMYFIRTEKGHDNFLLYSFSVLEINKVNVRTSPYIYNLLYLYLTRTHSFRYNCVRH